MKVLQLIDSLEAGGAERVAVNYANGLFDYVDGSYLCATRAEGLLKSSVNNAVGYLFLNKKAIIDVTAIWRLHRFIKKEGITVIHAHSSSYFLSTLITILNPKLKLVWHDHYGKSEFLEQRPKRILQYCSKYFDHIFSVNSKLKDWASSQLKAKTVSYLPNYAVVGDTVLSTRLKGTDGKRIVCLANLRPQKDHLNLLEAFKLVAKNNPDWTLHLIGKDFEDDYSKQVFEYIKSEELEGNVFFYGRCADVSAILLACNIGVLSSQSEGLPLALLEYGLAKLAVVATHVGECNQIIKNENTGLLVNAEDSKALSDAIINIIEDLDLRNSYAIELTQLIKTDFSETTTLQAIVNTYSRL
ncbi:glycosyltransferase [Algibacter sp. Ld11]|uniref:glycosyltransferase n=1 Tax=Algibacter sp. Ld11 TaxID=649150 RepID=UPI003862D8E9